MANESRTTELVDKAVADGGAYEIIRNRLIEHGDSLEKQAISLNSARAEEFGATEMTVVARTRVRTENNCVGRDIVQIGELLLFGYNVFIGLKKSTQVEDVFSLYKLIVDGDKHTMEQVSIGGSFLSDAQFREDFGELYRYYKETRLVQLVQKGGRLLAGFQIGERLDDRRVFRWDISNDNDVTYIDNRGERDLELPESYEFEWMPTKREDISHGRHPHVNILDELFVETTNGDLTVKIEDNTEVGRGVYSEPVDDVTQSLDDAEFEYARVGALILVRILPYKEIRWRYLVYNTRTSEIQKIDSLADSCVQLPEDHGIIFPEGIYLETGEYKAFGIDTRGLKFKRKMRSPNGEDVLFVFYEPTKGVVALLSYNVISKSLQNPLVSHGYALARDGTVIVFTAGDEPARIHPMQIWTTPYGDEEFFNTIPAGQSFFSRIGNAELVRGVSDFFSLCRIIKDESVSVKHYEFLRKAAEKLFDDYFWIREGQAAAIGTVVREIRETVELIVDEFEKVESIRRQSALAMTDAEGEQQRISTTVDSTDWRNIDQYVEALNEIRSHRGHLATIKEYRYIDVDRIAAMDSELLALNDSVGKEAAEFLAGTHALDSYIEEIESHDSSIKQRQTVAELVPELDKLDNIAAGLDLLSDLIATLNVDDATIQTRIVESISDVYSNLNQTRSRGRQRKERLGTSESVEQFGAQFKLFSQSVTNALGVANSPERCEELLARLLIQLEEMEGQFSEQDKFVADIIAKREEVYEAFEARKQQLLDARNSRAQTLADAAGRMLENIERRTRRFESDDELNTYLASDALVIKVRDIVEQLRELDSSVKADDVDSRLKMIRNQALRSLRDKTDLFSDGGKVIKLGSAHKFSVNTQDLDLTIIPRDDGLALHLVGTQYFENIDHPELNDLRKYWTLGLESETTTVYRGEYLAYRLLDDIRSGSLETDWNKLTSLAENSEALGKLVQNFAAPRYREGYEKGIHDADACTILRCIVPAINKSDLLRFDPLCRGYAQLIWANLVETSSSEGAENSLQSLPERAISAGQMNEKFSDPRAIELIEAEISNHVNNFAALHHLEIDDSTIRRCSIYLAAELRRVPCKFAQSKHAKSALDLLRKSLKADLFKQVQGTLDSLRTRPKEQWRVANAWLCAALDAAGESELLHYAPEAAAILIVGKRLQRRMINADVEFSVKNLFGQHSIIANGELPVTLDKYLLKMDDHCNSVIPKFHRYQKLRRDAANAARADLRLEEFKPKPLSSFVRNRLINDAYLPIIGDNLAKQIGTVSKSKRSDLQGLLMMISPPGYGKTTLMEYVASRLGLTFMKINCPSLGHDVTSLDPEMAPNATARQELHKLNLAFEMGDNVMLYLDDIQHTNAEFLQKFISLCDSTRRVDGVWKGRTRTYDLRGRKFCVVMAGNPYTESGEVFKIPDMLANRADIYNLGDVLSGKERQFELSYIENSLTSNAVLAPLAMRDMDDIYKLIERARGGNVATTDLKHQYSGAEVSEIVRVFKRLFVLQDVVLKVNKQYIASAAQDDKYRTEPRFLLQGSYRNMNKLAEKVSSAMNDVELQQMIGDHYRGEAQLLTQGTEANLLKLSELLASQDEADVERWEQIKKGYLRNKLMGGDDTDAGLRIAAQIGDLVQGISALGAALEPAGPLSKQHTEYVQTADKIKKSLDALGSAVKSHKSSVSITNRPSKEFAQVLGTLNETIEHTLFPLVRSMDKRIALDVAAHEKLKGLAEDVSELKKHVDQSD